MSAEFFVDFGQIEIVCNAVSEDKGRWIEDRLYIWIEDRLYQSIGE